MAVLLPKYRYFVQQFNSVVQRSLFCTILGQAETVKLQKLEKRNCVAFYEIARSRSGISHSTNSAVVKETGFTSKYCPISPQEATEEKMREMFYEKSFFSVAEWENIRNELILSHLHLSDTNFDSVVMNILLSQNNISLAKSFMEFLKHVKRNPNFVTCLKYMALCSKSISSSNQNVILEMYERIKHIVEPQLVLDRTTVDCIVQGLCSTNQWEKAFDYLKKLPDSSACYTESKSAIAAAALRNGDIELAWNILDTMFNPLECPNNYVFREYMNLVKKIHCEDVEKADKLFEKLLHYIQSKNIVIKLKLAQLIADYFKSHKLAWNIHFTKVKKKGLCDGCKKELERSKLTDEEYQRLKKAFYSRSVTKFDVFINTTEGELTKFLAYIENRKPFDFVIDGLNAAHSSDSLPKRQPLYFALLEVVKRTSLSSNRILVLGRRHMRSWPRRVLEDIGRRASIFFTGNTSQDDPFLIYATLASGPDTLFVSSDLMRDHVSSLDDPELIQLFRRWQLSHQIYLTMDDSGPLFSGPIKHTIAIQGNMHDGWHIPYDDDFILEPYEVLNNWLCIQRITTNLLE